MLDGLSKKIRKDLSCILSLYLGGAHTETISDTKKLNIPKGLIKNASFSKYQALNRLSHKWTVFSQ